MYGILRQQFGAYISAEDLRDIVADTLVEALKRGERFNPELSSLMRWLTVLGHYRALRFLRQAQLFSHVQLDDLANKVADKTETYARALVEQPSDRIEAFLQQLPPTLAKVIRLHYYDGLTIEEIAELLGIEVVSVRVYKSRGLNRLRDSMMGEDE